MLVLISFKISMQYLEFFFTDDLFGKGITDSGYGKRGNRDQQDQQGCDQMLYRDSIDAVPE